MTNVALLEEASGRGLMIRTTGENLMVQPASLCPEEFAEALRQNKPQLLALLRHDFLFVHSAALNETVYFAADQQAHAALVAAGAEPGCIYTRDELRELVELNRREPVTAGELLRIHSAKRLFNGRIVDGQVRST